MSLVVKQVSDWTRVEHEEDNMEAIAIKCGKIPKFAQNLC